MRNDVRLRVGAVVVLACSAAWAQTHLKFVRPVSVADSAKQAYIVIDETLLGRMKSDMGDLRLFSDAGQEVQYVLRTQRGARYSNWTAAKVLNKGSVQGNTQFTADIAVEEYDCLQIALATRDFVTKATVEGADDVTASAWNNLGTYSLYDFTREKLGSSDTIRLKTPTRYRYLRISIAGGVPPQDVEAVKIANLQESKAQYVRLAAQARLSQQGDRTIAAWDTSEKIPVERIVVEVDPAEINFSRDASLSCDGRQVTGAELSRVRLVRKGRQIESESLALEPYGLRCKIYKLEIANGDNSPLRILAVRPMMLERRLYFDPKGAGSLKLYYGDEKTAAPRYDYARFFEPAEPGSLAQATLQAEAVNPSFTEWPDERPFTERHPAVLWIAMLVAVGLLGAWALKGFRS